MQTAMIRKQTNALKTVIMPHANTIIRRTLMDIADKMGSDTVVENDDLRSKIELYGDMIRRICFVYMKQEADVEDMFQNVFLKYIRKKRPFENAEHEKAWFIRVTINECKNFLNCWFHKKVDLDVDLDRFCIEKNTLEYDILHAVQKLERKYRVVVYLYYYEGFSLREISAILNQKENTIYTWHSRAKEQLKKELGEELFNESEL